MINPRIHTIFCPFHQRPLFSVINKRIRCINLVEYKSKTNNEISYQSNTIKRYSKISSFLSLWTRDFSEIQKLLSEWFSPLRNFNPNCSFSTIPICCSPAIEIIISLIKSLRIGTYMNLYKITTALRMSLYCNCNCRVWTNTYQSTISHYFFLIHFCKYNPLYCLSPPKLHFICYPCSL